MSLLTPLLYPTVSRQFFVENATGVRSPETRRTWGNIHKRLQYRYPGRRIGAFDLDSLVDYLRRDEAGDPRPWASATTANNRAALIALFSWAHYAKIIREDPSIHLRRAVKVRRQAVRTHTWLSEIEIQSLFDRCSAEESQLLGTRDAVALGFGVLMGLRAAEIRNVRWEALNGSVLSLIGKGGKAATLPVPDALGAILSVWQGLSGDHATDSSPVVVPLRLVGGPIFGTEMAWSAQWGRQNSRNALQQMIHKRGSQIGQPSLCPHDLRRSFAGLLELKGVPLREIQALLRHDSIATTETYLKDNPAKLGKAARGALGGFSFGGGQ